VPSPDAANNSSPQETRTIQTEKSNCPAASFSEATNLALSFSGCGFLSSYHFGAAFCFQKHAKILLMKTAHFCGTSAGALISTLLLFSPEMLKEGFNQLIELAEEINSKTLGVLTPGFNLSQRLSEIINSYIPDDISPAQGHLFVSLTRIKDRSNKLISSYTDRQHLMDCLNASCYHPLYSEGFSKPPEIDGEVCIDGAYSNNLPLFSDLLTITISPFSGSAVISPQDENMFDWKMFLGNQYLNVNLENVIRGAQALFPPKGDVLTAYYEMGYQDAMKFLLENNLFECEPGSEV